MNRNTTHPNYNAPDINPDDFFTFHIELKGIGKVIVDARIEDPESREKTFDSYVYLAFDKGRQHPITAMNVNQHRQVKCGILEYLEDNE
jgi:hypothetical protein